MHGIGYGIGALGAILALFVWLLGRWARSFGPKPDR
jgi:hypothetical protein